MAELDDIYAEYYRSIPDKLLFMKGCIDGMNEKISLDALEQLRFLIHKMAGNAGVYGFPEVSTICHEFQQQLTEKLDRLKQGEEGDCGWVVQFYEYLEKIKQGYGNYGHT